ncbi:hypothetical protein [Sphingobium yanoikuyae]|uniref:hypothetical protein n=1 Tax=Sphingobium yanoikuyae TaxID=13690 RepID=UPI00242A59E2|nr:hypothetical protein [Sphingobium yanoikuyae]
MKDILPYLSADVECLQGLTKSLAFTQSGQIWTYGVSKEADIANLQAEITATEKRIVMWCEGVIRYLSGATANKPA